ncbi:MAG TPA: efflux transporter periplasmic adaptor subunit, partial [Nitrospirae bacterium]|nr:efflux transporter periplasmic adaptor subunit [Nitrospirota bacterium]
MSKRDLSHKNQGLLVIVVSFILLLIHSCEQKAQKIAPLPPSVEVVSVVQRDVPIYSEYIGTTDGFVNAVIRAQVQG